MKGKIAGLMQQAQKMQEEMQKTQEELARMEVSGEAGWRPGQGHHDGQTCRTQNPDRSFTFGRPGNA